MRSTVPAVGENISPSPLDQSSSFKHIDDTPNSTAPSIGCAAPAVGGYTPPITLTDQDITETQSVQRSSIT